MYITYCTVLYCTVLYCTVLYCTLLYFTVQVNSSMRGIIATSRYTLYINNTSEVIFQASNYHFVMTVTYTHLQIIIMGKICRPTVLSKCKIPTAIRLISTAGNRFNRWWPIFIKHWYKYLNRFHIILNYSTTFQEVLINIHLCSNERRKN